MRVSRPWLPPTRPHSRSFLALGSGVVGADRPCAESLATEDWDMLDVDEDDKLTGEEEFELLAGPLGLSERRMVPEAVQFPDSDPLGASVAMVTATNSMEETLLQIGNETRQTPAGSPPGPSQLRTVDV